jgi:hypothetical protein
MRGILFAAILTAAVLQVGGASIASAQQPNPNPSTGAASGSGQGTGQRMRGGMGGDFPAGARGLLGSVTEVDKDHYLVKTDAGDLYTVYFSENTRIMKQPAGSGRRFSPNGQGTPNPDRTANRSDTRTDPRDDADRPAPQPLKPTEIKVGDVVTAGGEMDTVKKSIGAIFILQLDPERAKQAREMQANYGKTWLAGRITAIDGTRITIDGMVDHNAHAIEVDENTSFRKRRDSITLADIKPGEQLRAEGAVKEGVFLATTVVTITPQNRDQNRDPAPNQP